MTRHSASALSWFVFLGTIEILSSFSLAAWSQRMAPSSPGVSSEGTSIVRSVTVQHPGSGRPTAYVEQILAHDVVEGSTGGVQEGLRVNITSSGSGTLATGGHIVGIQSEAYVDVSAQDLAIPIESVLANATGSLRMAYGFLAKLANNPGDIGTLSLFYPLVNNNGRIHTYIDLECNIPNGTGTITHRFCIRNSDSSQVIFTRGQVVTSEGELAPPAATAPSRDRYFWGVDHEAASGVIGTLKTNTHWAPFLMAARTTISRIGFNVVKASPKSSCSIVIHTASFGLPKTRLGGPYALSADTIGDREFAIRPPFLTLDAGLYDIGIHCSDDLVVVRGYVEQAAFAIFAAGSSQGADTSPVTGGEASAENPSIAYLSLNNEMPQIWLRR